MSEIVQRLEQSYIIPSVRGYSRVLGYPHFASVAIGLTQRLTNRHRGFISSTS